MMVVPIEIADANMTAGVPRKLFDLPPSRSFERDFPTFDITPDGKRFVVFTSAAPGAGRRQINIVLNWLQDLQT